MLYILRMKLTPSKIKNTVFTVTDVSRVLEITPASARVLCSRYVSSGQLIRLRKGLYVFRERWQFLSLMERFKVANRLQPASYISLGSALAWYEQSSQIYQQVVESVAKKRTITYKVEDWEFTWHRLADEYYNGYYRRDGIFIANPEKALADVIYLQSLGRYAFDFSALTWEAVNYTELDRYLEQFPQKTRLWWDRYGSNARS